MAEGLSWHEERGLAPSTGFSGGELECKPGRLATAARSLTTLRSSPTERYIIRSNRCSCAHGTGRTTSCRRGPTASSTSISTPGRIRRTISRPRPGPALSDRDGEPRPFGASEGDLQAVLKSVKQGGDQIEYEDHARASTACGSKTCAATTRAAHGELIATPPEFRSATAVK